MSSAQAREYIGLFACTHRARLQNAQDFFAEYNMYAQYKMYALHCTLIETSQAQNVNVCVCVIPQKSLMYSAKEPYLFIETSQAHKRRHIGQEIKRFLP